MDVGSDNCLEDGEIPDEDDTMLVYMPLQRPDNYGRDIKIVKPAEKHTDDDSEYSSISDSDSDEISSTAKKSKLKVDRKVYAHSIHKRKKYDIWCSHVQENLLAETLITCDVSNIDRSRDVESYIFPVRENNDEQSKRPQIKRRQDGSIYVKKYTDESGNASNENKCKKGIWTRKKKFCKKSYEKGSHNSAQTSLGHRKHKQSKETTKRKYDERNKVILPSSHRNSEDDDIKGAARIIPELLSTEDNTEAELATEITNKLCETNDALILKIVQIAGKKKSLEVFDLVRKIEADGGMFIMNNTKRRTPGGVFIFFVKHDNDIKEQQQTEIFAESRRQMHQERKAKQRAKSKLIKAEIQQKREEKKKLPDLLNRADLTVLKLRNGALEHRESETEECVNNPPPSPVTDGKENSSDGMNDATTPPVLPGRELNTYEDDFLDLGNAADMDLF